MANRDLCILVIDGDATRRELIRALAECSGWASMAACDGRDGLVKMREFRPDIVMTTWSMSGTDGIALVRAIRAAPDIGRPYIILATERDDEDKLLEAFDAGIDDFVSAPLRTGGVAARLRAGLHLIQVRRQNEHDVRHLRPSPAAPAESGQRLWDVAATDQLTGLPNRHYALARLQQEWSASEPCDAPLSCLVVDVNGLTRIYRVEGSRRGDVVLKTVAASLRKSVRNEDIVCRIGAGEFLVICPATSLDGIIHCGERLVRVVGAFGIRAEGSTFGLAIGAAGRGPEVGSPQELIDLARQGMRDAERAGGNRVYSSQADELRCIGESSSTWHCRREPGGGEQPVGFDGAQRKDRLLGGHGGFLQQ